MFGTDAFSVALFTTCFTYDLTCILKLLEVFRLNTTLMGCYGLFISPKELGRSLSDKRDSSKRYAEYEATTHSMNSN